MIAGFYLCLTLASIPQVLSQSSGLQINCAATVGFRHTLALVPRPLEGRPQIEHLVLIRRMSLENRLGAASTANAQVG